MPAILPMTKVKLSGLSHYILWSTKRNLSPPQTMNPSRRLRWWVTSFDSLPGASKERFLAMAERQPRIAVSADLCDTFRNFARRHRSSLPGYDQNRRMSHLRQMWLLLHPEAPSEQTCRESPRATLEKEKDPKELSRKGRTSDTGTAGSVNTSRSIIITCSRKRNHPDRSD